MEKWASMREALDFAIEREEEAAAFYADMAKRAGTSSMRKVFESFATEELGHKKKLEAVKTGDIPADAEKKVMDLKIGDYLVDIAPTPDMSYQDTLILAMKREKASYRLYIDLAALSDEADLCSTFLFLAKEEAQHKLRFEIEYDDNVLTEN